jgi:UV DNA damage repair endonuclease
MIETGAKHKTRKTYITSSHHQRSHHQISSSASHSSQPQASSHHRRIVIARLLDSLARSLKYSSCILAIPALSPGDRIFPFLHPPEQSESVRSGARPQFGLSCADSAVRTSRPRATVTCTYMYLMYLQYMHQLNFKTSNCGALIF